MPNTAGVGSSAPSGVASRNETFRSVGLPPPPRYIGHPRTLSDKSRLPSHSEVAKLRPLTGRVIKPRRKKGSEILPHPNRPHVAAPDRLRCWTFPQTLSHTREMRSEISDDLVRKINIAIISSLKESTRGDYGAALLRFIQFCDREGIPEENRMPASRTLLAAFAADCARPSISGKTIGAYLTGLHAWHIINGAEWHGDDEFVEQVLSGARNLSAPAGKKPPRPPVSLEHMFALYRNLRPFDFLDAVIWAVACIAFWACCRLGELLPNSEVEFDPRYHPSRLDLSCYDLRSFSDFP